MMDTLLMEYKQTLGKHLTLEHAEGKRWNLEHQQRLQVREELDELQQYMVMKGFKFIGNKVVDPEGQEHIFNK